MECLGENNKRKLRRPVAQKKPIGQTLSPPKQLWEFAFFFLDPPELSDQTKLGMHSGKNTGLLGHLSKS